MNEAIESFGIEHFSKKAKFAIEKDRRSPSSRAARARIIGQWKAFMKSQGHSVLWPHNGPSIGTNTKASSFILTIHKIC